MIDQSRADNEFAWLKPWHWVTLLTLAGAAWRWFLFSGDGLWDDPNYFVAYYDIFSRTYLTADVFSRFASWMPIYVAWKLFGINEYSWILPVTATSVATIPITYLIGKHVSSTSVGLMAALFFALSPFDVLTSTLFAIDVVLSFYLSLSVLFFLYGLSAQKTRAGVWYALAALCLFFGYLTKMWALFIIPLFFILSLTNRKRSDPNFSSTGRFSLSAFLVCS